MGIGCIPEEEGEECRGLGGGGVEGGERGERGMRAVLEV
jgi:hypothetical protein